MPKIQTPAAWVGWVYFGASMLVLIGAMLIVQGLGALFNPDFFVATGNGVFALNLTAWGWIHTIIGIVALASGIGTMAGASWARIVSVVVTVLAMVASIAYITTFPIWATFMLIIGAFVVYALTVHGAEVRDVL